MDSIRTYEIIGNVAQRVYKVGSFVVQHLQGGGRGSLPSTPALPSAHMAYFPNIEAEYPSGLPGLTNITKE